MDARTNKATRLGARAALFACALALLFAMLAPTVAAQCDFRQHKTNVLTGGTLPQLDGWLEITKTVRNADGTPLTPEQAARQFAFTVTFGDGGAYRYVIQGGPQGELAPAAPEEPPTKAPVEQTTAVEQTTRYVY